MKAPARVPGRQRLNERLRAAFIAGAEEDSRRRVGRGLTSEELERVLRRYPRGRLGRATPMMWVKNTSGLTSGSAGPPKTDLTTARHYEYIVPVGPLVVPIGIFEKHGGTSPIAAPTVAVAPNGARICRVGHSSELLAARRGSA